MRLSIGVATIMSSLALVACAAPDPTPVPSNGFIPASDPSAEGSDATSDADEDTLSAPTEPGDADSGTEPPSEPDAATPSAADSGAAKPATDSGSTAKPPADSGTTSKPPADSGTKTKPPADSGTPWTPPADTGTWTPPADTGTKHPADSSTSEPDTSTSEPDTSTSEPDTSTPIDTAVEDTATATDTGSSVAPTYVTHQVTFYGYPDNSPPGTAIALPVIHSGAGGTGTYADPVTFATATGEFAKGTILYVPFIKKYVIMEDTCAACATDWAAGKRHIDIWMNSNSTNTSKLLSCQYSWTRPSVDVEINPPPDRPVNATPLFEPSTGVCQTSM